VPCFAAEPASEAAVFGEADGELDVGGVCAPANAQRATATTQTPLMRQVLVFMVWVLIEFGDRYRFTLMDKIRRNFLQPSNDSRRRKQACVRLMKNWQAVLIFGRR
jgi:hypothetical protein